MVLVFQTCLQVNRITGDLSQVGAEFIKILVHEFGPSLTAMMLATRVGAGIAAEIGSMVVTEQIDALRMSGVDPDRLLDRAALPRLAGHDRRAHDDRRRRRASRMGALTALLLVSLQPVVFLDPSHVRVGDLADRRHEVRAPTAPPFPSSPASAASRARGGSEGVGTATTRAVISAASSVILLDFFFSGVALFTFQRGADDLHFATSTKSFGGKPVLRGVDLEVQRGEVLFIIGTSGVGKTVTIKHLVGLLPPRRRRDLARRHARRRARRARALRRPQEVRDGLPALDAVRLDDARSRTWRCRCASTASCRERAAEARRGAASSRCTCRRSRDSYPAELGDGMRKRAAIARALTLDPEYVLFDEPTTGLDPVSARRIDKLIRELADEQA